MTKVNTFAAKLAVAFVATAMLFTMFAPATQAQTVEELQAQIAALMAQINALTDSDGSTSSSSVCPYTWTRTLNMGDTGADVKMLQTFLNSQDGIQVAVGSNAGAPGMETSYYGPATGAAVAQFQEQHRMDILSPLGLVNSTTFFGPSTMSKANALCATAPVDEDDDDDATDEDDDATEDDGPTLGNGEGDIDRVDGVSSDESEVNEGQTAGVFGFEVEIEGDIEIDRADVYLDHTGTGSDNADDYFDEAVLMVDGVEVASVDVADFDEDDYDVIDTGAGEEFRIRFASLGLVFEDGDEPEFQVAFKALNNIDSSDLSEQWTVQLASDSIRYMDGVGFTGTAGDSHSDTFTVEAEDAADWTFDEASSNPDAATLEVDRDDNTEDVAVFVFDIEEDQGVDGTIDDMTFDVVTGTADVNDVVTEVALYVDGDELDSATPTGTGTSQQVEFENLGLDIGADDTVEVTIMVTLADTNSDNTPNYADGETVTVSFGATTSYITDATDENGNDESEVTMSGGTVSSETHTLRETGVSVVLDDADTSVIENDDTTAADDEGKFTIDFSVEAFGDTLYLPFGASSTATTADAVTFAILDEDGNDVTANGTTSVLFDSSDSNIEETNAYEIGENDTESFTLTVEFDPTTAGSYRLQITSVNYNTVDAATTTNSQNVEAEDIRTAKTLI